MDPALMETVQSIIVLCTFVTGLSAALNVFSAWHQKAKSPEKIQNDRLSDLERYAQNDKNRLELLEKNYGLLNESLVALTKQTESMQEELDKQKDRMQSVERGERVTQRALLALINYMVNINDGQDKSSLVEARNNLNDYLLGK